MALFGKLFEKKVCDICGQEIGMMGNRKLADGNCCKNCASQLSPWFSERKTSTVDEIREQLAYREENREKVSQFHTTRTLGRGTKVLLDEDNRLFAVTSASRLSDSNPDVLAFSQVTGCELDVRENSTEVRQEFRDKEGKWHSESYNPKRYTYSYDFYLTIYVSHPWFDQMQFRLNPTSVSIDIRDGIRSSQIHGQPRTVQRSGRNPVLEGSTTAPTLDMCRNDPEYVQFETMAAEIKEALMQVRQEARDAAAAQTARPQAVLCPYCGATTTPDASGCCEYCGSALG